MSDNIDNLIEINEISKLLESYKQNDFKNLLKKSNGQVTLIVGLSGAGKSTISQFLANNQKLMSKSEAGSYDFFISDNNNTISESTITSKTWLPSLVHVKNRQSHPLLDCPGFLDTRSNLHEIATSVFTKNVMKNVEKVKIVVITSHHAVRKGVDRSNFTDLLTNLAGFVKQIGKYEKSIALVVNKVENQPIIDESKNITLVSDAEIIKQIALFIAEVKMELKDSLAPESATRDKMLEIFLHQKDEQYSNIKILRRPDKTGYLHEIELLQDQKLDIEKLIFKKLDYAACDADDFGMPLSEGARLSAYKTEEKIRSEIQAKITFMCESIVQKYNSITKPHFSDFFPILGPKRKQITDVKKMIKKIESRNNENFHITKLFDWFSVGAIPELMNTKEELLKIFHDYEFLGSIVNIQSNDYQKFFFQFDSLGKSLSRILEQFEGSCCYCGCCF
jgi:energy-coupling factor transporter ATP-binding protein EcfA2